MKNLLIIGFVWPEPSSTAAGTRMLQLIEVFKKNNYNITFASTSSKTKNSFNFTKTNIQTSDIQLNNSSFDLFLKTLNPNIVLFDRFLTEEQFGWRVAEICPNALRILDTEDLHFLRNARKTALKKNEKLSLSLLMNDLTKRELASIYRCDLTLIISKFELKLLKKKFKVNKSLLQYVPFLLDPVKLDAINSYPAFEERKNFVTIGNFKHEPNWNALLYLKSKIWPLIHQKLPDAKMLIYGAYATNKVNQLHNEKENFYIKGWTESTQDIFINARICLAPLQFGAGLKGKLVEAMQFGTPSVTTKIGAEGMHKNLPWNGFIEDSVNEFAQKSVELYTNQKLWKISQQHGIEIINKCFSKEKYSKKLIKKIELIKKGIIRHRLNNITGALLTHHTVKSTKYMAKWIEEKNKK